MSDNKSNVSKLLSLELTRVNGDNLKLREEVTTLKAQTQILSQIMRDVLMAAGNKAVSLLCFYLRSTVGIILAIIASVMFAKFLRFFANLKLVQNLMKPDSIFAKILNFICIVLRF